MAIKKDNFYIFLFILVKKIALNYGKIWNY